MSYQSHIASVLRDQGPKSTDEIVEACDMRLKCAREVIRHLHDKREIHILRWFKTSKSQYAAVWAVGDGEDAPKPEWDKKPVVSAIRKRHPMVAQIAAMSDDFRNPFATAMWNVAQGSGERG